MTKYTFLSLLVGVAAAFSPLSNSHTRAVNTARFLSSVALDYDYRTVLSKARECAFSDTADPSQARHYLHELLLMQSECISGSLLGSKMCENVDEVAEIVAHLRAKATVSTLEATALQTTNMLLLPALFLVLSSTFFHAPGSETLTLQEWFWAARDGYVDTLLAHLVKNGGLVLPNVDPFSTTEWMHALQGGYLDLLMSPWAKNGGWIDQTITYTPEAQTFTWQEVRFAFRDGYVDTLIKHWFHNGGL